MNWQKNQRHDTKGGNAANRLTIALLAIYLIVLIWILVFKLGVRFSYAGNRSVNLVPFSKPSISKGRVDLSEIILNVVVFLPLGIYVGILFRTWTFLKKLFLFFLLSLIVEGLQFVLAVGAFDITDVITNTSGGILGLMIFKAIEKTFNNSIKAQKFLNIVAAVGTVLMVALLVLLKMNMLPIRYQ